MSNELSAWPVLDEEGRARVKQWLEHWRVAGPVLDRERWERLAAMTDEEAQEATRRVLELWQADWPSDEGEALLLHQRVFVRARQRA